MGNAGISVKDDSLNTHIINNITNLPNYEIIFNFLVVIVEKFEREVYLELSAGMEGDKSKWCWNHGSEAEEREKSNAPRKLSVGRNGELKECWRYLNMPAHYVDGAF